MPGTQARDWHAWHDDYDVPDSRLARRLATVQERIRATLAGLPAGPVRALSICAGQGRDLIGALDGHPRRHDVRARLVEADPRNARLATAAAERAGLSGIEVAVDDAGYTGAYADLVPVDLVLLCGVFGNISDADIRRTVGYCTRLCRSGGAVIWTRHRRPPDLVPQICAWFAEVGFAQTFVTGPDVGYGVGAHRFTGTPEPPGPGTRLFRFLR